MHMEISTWIWYRAFQSVTPKLPCIAAINLLLREIEKKEEIDLRMKPSLEIQDLQIGGGGILMKAGTA